MQNRAWTDVRTHGHASYAFREAPRLGYQPGSSQHPMLARARPTYPRRPWAAQKLLKALSRPAVSHKKRP
eukprot:11803723-Alexandrium_andersonii.AAC.1